MTTKKLVLELPAAKGKNRRSDRYPVVVPVRVKWLEASGASVIEFAEAKEVNMHGGLLEMKGRPAVNSVVELTNLGSTRTASAQVKSQRLSKQGEVMGVAVELLTPSESDFPAEGSHRRPAETGKGHERQQIGWNGSSSTSRIS